ncbi:hypothetical protein [Glaciihabitans sp. dw_435]|uniref:hypothetical protein n=1 Tax=Glaciihabitans sp. dw_435 TaxID=2720081 RepID=UPI001BD59A8C|nr:hypothetical protein [Glaciihabitans sp. dw_435]
MLTETADTATPSVFGRALIRPLPTLLYIAVTLLLTTGGLVLGLYGHGGLSLIPFWIGIALTGPLGVVATIFAGVPLLRIVADASTAEPLASPDILDGYILGGLIILFVTTALVVVLNALLVRRWVYATRASIDQGDPHPVRRAIDRFVGSWLFIYSGAGFVLLCLVAAYGSIVGTVSDYASPETASTLHTVIQISFLIALASAAAGLVLWIVFTKIRRPILIPAAVDFVIIAVAFVAVVVAVRS